MRILIAGVAAMSWPGVASAQQAVYLVRHSHKEQQGDSLSGRGKLQAEKLARLLAEAGITAIYTTQFERTKQTAQKLESILADRKVSVRKGVVPLPEDLLTHPDNHAALEVYAQTVVDKLRKEASNEVVLLVGHDLTVPAIVKALGCRTDVVINREQFGHLFVVIPGDGKLKVTDCRHIPDYMIIESLNDQFSGTSKRGDVGEATREAVKKATEVLNVERFRWHLKEVESATNGLTIIIEVDRNPTSASRALPEANTYTATGSSRQEDFPEAVREAISELYKRVPNQLVRWHLDALHSGRDGLTATLLGRVGPPPDDDLLPAGTFAGESGRGDVAEALAMVVGTAKRSLQKTAVRLRVRSIKGRTGGFRNERAVTVIVEPMIPD